MNRIVTIDTNIEKQDGWMRMRGECITIQPHPGIKFEVKYKFILKLNLDMRVGVGVWVSEGDETRATLTHPPTQDSRFKLQNFDKPTIDSDFSIVSKQAFSNKKE
jgi:hypothetical protein